MHCQRQSLWLSTFLLLVHRGKALPYNYTSFLPWAEKIIWCPDLLDEQEAGRVLIWYMEQDSSLCNWKKEACASCFFFSVSVILVCLFFFSLHHLLMSPGTSGNRYTALLKASCQILNDTIPYKTYPRHRCEGNCFSFLTTSTSRNTSTTRNMAHK